MESFHKTRGNRLGPSDCGPDHDRICTQIQRLSYFFRLGNMTFHDNRNVKLPEHTLHQIPAYGANPAVSDVNP